jgi:hypothetical protein
LQPSHKLVTANYLKNRRVLVVSWLSTVLETWEEDEDSFRTPLNHAGVYGLFLANELTNAHSTPLTEWALSWISDLAHENPDSPTEDEFAV